MLPAGSIKLQTAVRGWTSIDRTVVAAAVTLALVAASIGLAGRVDAAPGQLGQAARPSFGYVSGSILVRYRPGTTASTKARTEAAAGAHSTRAIDALGVRVLHVPAGAEAAAIDRLRHAPAVLYAERDGRAEAADTSTNDYYFNSQKTQSYNQLHVPAGWDASTGSTNAPLVAVIDTGVQASHPDLAGRLVAGWNVVTGNSNPADDNGHGTMVSGMIAANANNSVGIAGLCWACQVMPVKVLDAAGSGSYSNIATGITWAADHGARIINLSLGGSAGSSTLQNAVDYAVAKGALVLAAAGNTTCDCVLYPAAYANVIAVGAVSSSNANVAAWGSALDVMAPGSNWATYYSPSYPTLQYAVFTGTSSATPVVAGLAALLMSEHPTWSAATVRSQIESTATDLGTSGWDATFGHGIVNFAAALGVSASPSPTPSSAPTATPTAVPTPDPTVAPTPAPTTAPTPTPTPSATPTTTATPSPTPSTATTTFSGTVNAKQRTRSYALACSTGPVTLTLKTVVAGVSVSLVSTTGQTMGTASMTIAQGASTVSVMVPAGSYSVVVTGTGTKASFTVTVTYAT